MNRQVLDLRIDRVVLEGIDLQPGEIGRLREALADALGAWLTGVAHDGFRQGAAARLTSAPLSFDRAPDGRELARGIADVVRQAVSPGGGRE